MATPRMTQPTNPTKQQQQKEKKRKKKTTTTTTKRRKKKKKEAEQGKEAEEEEEEQQHSTALKQLTQNSLLDLGLRVIQVHQQPFVQGLQVSAVQTHFVVLLEAVKVGQEGVGDHHPDLVAAVVQSLQQLRVHVVQAVLVQGATERVERARHDAAADEASALVVLVHGRGDLGDELLGHRLQLSVKKPQHNTGGVHANYEAEDIPVVHKLVIFFSSRTCTMVCFILHLQ